MQKVAQFTFEIPIKRSKYPKFFARFARKCLGGFYFFLKFSESEWGVLFEEGFFIFKSLVDFWYYTATNELHTHTSVLDSPLEGGQGGAPPWREVRGRAPLTLQWKSFKRPAKPAENVACFSMGKTLIIQNLRISAPKIAPKKHQNGPYSLKQWKPPLSITDVLDRRGVFR